MIQTKLILFNNAAYTQYDISLHITDGLSVKKLKKILSADYFQNFFLTVVVPHAKSELYIMRCE